MTSIDPSSRRIGKERGVVLEMRSGSIERALHLCDEAVRCGHASPDVEAGGNE
jgi:hypothetical protein